MANVMKMAFVINGALSQNFTTSIGRAQKAMANLHTYIGKLNESQRQQTLIYSTGAMSLKQYENNIARLGRQIDTANKKIKSFQTAMSKRNESRANYNTAKIDFLSTMQSVQTATAPLADAFDVAANFEKAMSKVGAISLGGVNGEEYNRQLKMLTDTARQLGERTQFTATQSAEAMSYLGMAGWKTNQIIEGMPALLSLAVAGGTDLARTADIVSDNLTAFGLAAKDSTHMADVYATVITNTNTNVEMLGETMKYAAPIAHAFGASMEETAAMAGLMANAGIKASQAGTSLRAGFLRLAGPPKAAAKELDKLGISISDVSKEQAEANAMLKSMGVETGTLEGGEKMASILSQLRERFKGMSENEKVAAGQAIFGRNAVTGWLAMLDSEAGAFENLVTQLRNCDGAAAKMEQRMNSNAKGAATRMKSAYESLQISLMNGFLPTIANVLDGVAKFTGALSRLATENPTIAKSFVLVTAGIATVVSGLAAFGLATAAIRYGIDGFKFWKMSLEGCTIATKAYSAAQMASAAVTGILTKVTAGLGAVMAATPIGWLIAGIAALVIAGTLLYRNWEKVKAFFTNLWESPTARTMMFIAGPIGWVIGITSAIIANWDTLKAYFEYFWDNPEAALFRFQNWVQESFQNAVNAGREKWNELKAVLDKPIFATFVAPAWDSLKNSASQAYESITEKIGTAFDGVKTSIGNALESAKQTILNLPETIAYGIGYAAGYLYDSLTQLPGKVMTLVQQAGRFLSDLPNACYQAGVNFLNRLSTWASQAYDSMVNFLTQTVTSAWEFLMGLPDACYQAGAAFIDRLTTWGGEAFNALVAWLTNLVNSTRTFLSNLPTICMEAGRNFVSAAAQWAQDAYNSIMDWITRLPDAISNTISNAWEGIKAKFSAGFTVGVSAANNGAPVAANAKGGIYNKGAFLTTFAERSPEAAIPIDNSERAKWLWMRVGQMLGMLQRPQRNTAPVLKLPQIFPPGTGYDPKPLAIPNIPIMPELPAPELPDIQPQKETLIERVKEFVAPTVRNRAGAHAPNVTINNSFHFTGAANQQEIRETVERSADISYAKFRELMLQFQHEQRRTAYE